MQPPSVPAGDVRLSALLAFFAARRPQLVAFVRRRVGDGGGTEAVDAEDLLQQAMLRATERVASVRDDARLEAWFYRVLRHTIADHHAGRARRDGKLELLSHEEEAAPEPAEVCACTLGLLSAIRPEYRDIIQRIDLDEDPLAETANALRITPNNAAVRLSRGRKALREALVRKCGTDSARACADCGCE